MILVNFQQNNEIDWNFRLPIHISVKKMCHVLAAESSSTSEMTDNTLEAASTLEKTADGTPKDGTTEDGTLSDGTAKDGTPTDGTPKDGAPTDGTPKDGTPTAQQPTPLASVYVTPGGEICKYDEGKSMNVTLVAISGTIILVPHFKSSHCYPFEDHAPVDEIYGCTIFKWVAVTWLPR